MMKRKILIVSVLLTILLLCGSAAATEASEPVVCTIELSTSYLAAPGPVDVTITVANATNEDLKDPVVLYDPAAQIVPDFGTDGELSLKAGETYTWTGSYDVNQRTLDNGSVVYFLRYTIYQDDGQGYDQSTPIQAKITQQAAEAAMQVKRTISPTVAQEGQKVTVHYSIINTGTVSLTNIEIAESKDVHKDVQKIPELKAGQTAEIDYPVTMGKKNLTSGATITYTSEGNSETQTYVVENQTITYGQLDLTATLTSSSKGVVKNEVVTLTLTLRNKGSVDFSDIRVTDATLGEVFSNQELAAGKTLELTKDITLTTTTDYQFTVTAVDSTGAESVTGTDVVTVTAVNPEDALHLEVVASPDQTEAYGNPATVRFSIKITNDSNVAANKVTVSHGDTEITTLTTIPAGESRTITRDTALSTTGKFQFTVTAQDPLENDMVFQSNEMQIAIYAPTPVPATPTPAPNPTPEPTFNPATIAPITNPNIGAVPKMIQSILLPLLILVGVMLVASLVLLVIATKRRADQKKASEAAFDHLERAKRRDYVTPAEETEEKTEAAAAEEQSSKKHKAKKKLTKEEQDAQMANRRLVGEDRDDLDIELPHLKYARDAVQQKEEQEEESGFSALGHGLYDDDLTSDLSTLHENGWTEEEAPTVLYEQPGEETEALPEEDTSAESSIEEATPKEPVFPSLDDQTDDYLGTQPYGQAEDFEPLPSADDYDTQVPDEEYEDDGYTHDLQQEYGAVQADPNGYEMPEQPYGEDDGLYDEQTLPLQEDGLYNDTAAPLQDEAYDPITGYEQYDDGVYGEYDLPYTENSAYDDPAYHTGDQYDDYGEAYEKPEELPAEPPAEPYIEPQPAEEPKSAGGRRRSRQARG